ncbi:hypothetical protein [Litorisediminicola beolgyonensis]|uniref:Uncharacterized protein n=1 Tax=Litorisediminicola beolgyonensis TaxID=1173614 RepID=A0ABW3ZHX9_9RHOB
MSAPDTNTGTQEKRHAPSLFGIKASLTYGLVLLAAFVAYVFFASGDSSETAPEGGSALEGYESQNYEPGGNSTGSVSGQPDQ